MNRIKAKTEDSKAKTNLDFYQELKKNKKPIKKTPNQKSSLKRTTVKQRNQSSQDKTAAKQTDGRTKPKNKSVRKPVIIDLPAPGATQARKADNTLKSLTIQAAALKNRSEADELVRKLKQKGYPAYKTVGAVPNKGVWFRVRIGEYSSKEAAAGTISRLKKDGFKPYLVTR